MAFQKLQFNLLQKSEMLNCSRSFLANIKTRRSVREFSDRPLPIELITNAVKAASLAPSGANKQPWHFVIVKDLLIKKRFDWQQKKKKKRFIIIEPLMSG